MINYPLDLRNDHLDDLMFGGVRATDHALISYHFVNFFVNCPFNQVSLSGIQSLSRIKPYCKVGIYNSMSMDD